MERFKLSVKDNLIWTVFDNESGFSIDFREGLFNETQEVHQPTNLTEEQILSVPATMREIADWLAQEHPEVAICNVEYRKTAVYMLSNEKYWLAMADACNSLIIDWDEENLCEMLIAEMEDYYSMDNGIGLSEAEFTNMRGALSMMSNEEVNEALEIVLAFWKDRDDSEINEWARDILWWPAWANKAKEDGENKE